jgi:hypothetical protein
MSPKETLTKFLTAMEHEQFAEAKKYATADSQSFLDMISKSNNASADVYKDQDFTTTGKVSINGDEADVEVRGNGSSGIDFHLKKESGAWKVDFNLNALFNMVKGVLKKTGTDVQKEVDQAIDSIKIGLDSLP